MLNPCRFTMAIAALTAATTGLAAPITPKPPIAQGSSPIPPGSRCTVEALNVGGIVRPDGSMFVPNVPSNQGQVRLRAACTDPFGAVSQGQSPPVTPIPGSAVSVGGVDFGATTPIAARLTILPASASLTSIGATQQLSVGSVFADQTSGDVTAAAAGTTYRTSNPAVVTVSPDGVLTAVGVGTAIVSAQNEGAMGLATVTVRSAALVNLEVYPSSLLLSVNPAFRSTPAQLSVRGALADGGSVEMSSAASGVAYASSNPSVAVVGADGAVLGLSSGSSTITISDSATGLSAQVPVVVNAYPPSPVAAYDTPGFARGVDLRGSVAFVADDTAGLQVIDLHAGTTIGALAFPGKAVRSVRVRDSLVAAGLSTGDVAIIDASDPARPEVLSQVYVGNAVAVQDLWISGNRVYAATPSRLHIVDVTSPASPALLSTHALGYGVNAVAADSARGVIVAVTAQPAVVVLREEGPLPWPSVVLPLPAATNQARDVALLGTTAYVANGRDGVWRVDVTDPAEPRLTAHSTLDFDALGVAVRRTPRGTVIAAADDLFVNAVPLFEPGLVNTFNIDFSAGPAVQLDANGTGIALGERYGVVTVGAAGIQVFRLEEPSDNGGVAPTVALSQPADELRVAAGAEVTVLATAVDDVEVASVQVLVDGAVVATDATPPYGARVIAGAACTTQAIEARAVDWGGNEALSLPVSLRVLCEGGQPCAGDADCASAACVSGACSACSAGGPVDCAAILAADPLAPSGVYTIDPDGAGCGQAFEVYCEMALGGGGWTLAAKLTNQDGKHWIDAASSWTGRDWYGITTDLGVGADAKSQAWGSLPVSDMMMTDNVALPTGGYVQTSSGCLEGLTPAAFFTAALANYPDPSGQNQYKQCATSNNYIPSWTLDPGFLGQTPQSPWNSLHQGYLTIAKTDVSDTQGVISFYYLGTIQNAEPEADVGLGPSEWNLTPFGLNNGFQQDIGGPSSCNGNDAQCAAMYPETVFLFVR